MCFPYLPLHRTALIQNCHPPVFAPLVGHAMRCNPTVWLAAVILAVVSPLGGQEANRDESGFAVPGVIARRISGEYRALDDRRRRLEIELADLARPPRSERGTRLGWKVFGYDGALQERQWVEIDLGGEHRIDSVVLIPIDAPTTGGSEPGIGFPVRFRVEGADENGALTSIFDCTNTDFPNPGSLPVFHPAGGLVARRVRVTLSKPWAKDRYHAYALGEIMVLSGNRNLATGLRGVTVRSSGSLERGLAWGRDNLIDGQSVVGAPLAKSDRPLAHGWESSRFSAASSVAWVQIDLGSVQTIDEVRLIPARLLEYGDAHGYGFPARFRAEVSNDPEMGGARLLADWSAQQRGDPGFNPLTLPGDRQPGRYLRVTAEELWERQVGVYVFALGELQVYWGDNNVALGAPVHANSVTPPLPANFKPAFLTDGLRGTQKFIEWPEWLASLSRRREVLSELERVRVSMATLQPALIRATAWSGGGMIGALILGTLAVFYRARRIQARTVMALQRRIAGDLHDEIGSNLASIAMLTELSQQQKASLPTQDVEEIRRLATESAAAMRDIVWLIQPGPHDATRLADRLRSAARRLVGGVEWNFQIVGLDEAPSLDVQRHLLLALKEMLHNVLRHAGAHRVEIRLTVREQKFVLEVRDDGRGGAEEQTGECHGLTSLRHRAELLGGKLELESNPGQGTRVALNGSLFALPQPSTSPI